MPISVLDQILTFTQISLETLPISSSTHVLIIKKFYTTFIDKLATASADLSELSNIPTIVVLAIYFWPELKAYFCKTTEGCTGKLKEAGEMLMLGLTSCSITIFFYILKKMSPGKQIVQMSPQMLMLALFISSLILLSLIFKREKSETFNLTLGQAAIIGVAQSLSLLTGISRLGITTMIGCWMGNSARNAFRYSVFLHAILSIGLFVKSALVDLTLKGTIFSLEMSPLVMIVIAIAMFISGLFLNLTDRLTRSEVTWVFGLYYPIPILTILFLSQF